jgi:hypothetical protein
VEGLIKAVSCVMQRDLTTLRSRGLAHSDRHFVLHARARVSTESPLSARDTLARSRAMKVFAARSGPARGTAAARDEPGGWTASTSE